MKLDATTVWLALAIATGSCSGYAADDKISRESLFEDEKQPAAQVETGWKGFAELQLARTLSDPAHSSKARMLLEFNRQGAFSERIKWKIGGRFDYDGVYDHSSFYPQPVKHDQRGGFTLRENYLDIGAGDWDFRLGRQHVVWGEMVGMFFADVVSAKDMREFLLPEFEVLRIPQWAARAEYFKNDWHVEVLWIPLPSFDEMGKPGADFYPTPLPGPGGTIIQGEAKPARKLANSNYGLRLSTLQNGWDVSGFYYHSLDSAATFYRDLVAGPAPSFVYRPRHDAIDQAGGTLAKDLGWTVLKGEAVYTDGRKFNVTRLTQADGLVASRTLDYALGLDFTPAAEVRLNAQFFQRIYADHDPDTLQDRRESGASLLLNGKLAPTLEGQLLLISSLNRSDYLFRPRLVWNFVQNWRLMSGVDVFHGPPTGLFGRYDHQDRVYAELRYSF